MGNLMSSLRWRATNFSLSQLRLFDFPRKLHSSASSEKDGITDTTTADLPAESQKHILIVGGAYSGLSTIITLQKILSGTPHNPGPYNLPSVPRLPRVRPRITLLDERDGCYHTVGTPLVHTSPEVSTTAPRAWKKFADIPYLKDVAVVRGSVQRVDPELKTVVYATYDACAGEQQHSLPYDYIVCATGLKRDWPAQPRATTKTEYIHDAAALVRGLVDAKERIVVVGGGLFPSPVPLSQSQKLSQRRGSGSGICWRVEAHAPGQTHHPDPFARFAAVVGAATGRVQG